MAKNSLDTALTIHAGVKGINELKRLSDEIKTTGTNTEALDKAADDLQKSWKNLSPDEQTKKVKELGDEFKRLKAISDAKIAIGLTDYQKTQNELDKVKQAFKDLKASGTLSKKELRIATEQYKNKVKELNQELGKTPFQLKNLTKGVSGLMASLGVGLGLAEIIQLSDEFNNLEARVRLATQSGGDFAHAMSSIKDIADSTMMPLTATGDLFGKLTQATKELGYSQSDVLGLTKTISQAMAVSGGDMASMEAGLTQLAQGLSAGALRGDEFNSVVEQSPRLAQAMADGLGVSIGQLRVMAGEGKLTAEVVGDALKSQSSIIAQEFAQMPQTVSGSLTVLKNSLMGFIGELDNELGGSDGMANFIKNIATYIDEIDPSVIESLSNALSSLGVLAKSAYDGLMTIPNALSDIVNGFMGMEEGSEQLSLLKALMDGLALTTGAVADGITALNVISKLVFGNIVRDVGQTLEAFGKLTGVGDELAKSLIESGQAMIDNAEQIASNYESRLGKAMDTIATDSQTKLQQVADTARAKYEQMAQDGQASATALENAFKDYAHKAIQANNGVVDEVLKQELAQKNLQAVVDETGKVIIESMTQAKTAVDGVDLSKHAESFKALGIDIQEFATGIDSKASTALSAFSELSGVVGQDIEQLGKLYQATKDKIGENEKAQEALNAKLLESVGGNTELAVAIKRYAAELNNAKNTITDKNKALAELGVNMQAINQGMSDGGQKIAQSLKVGLSAIKETAQGADSLKTALSQAFDTATKSAKTKQDFMAIKQAISEAGLMSQLTSEQLTILNAGIQGGSEAVELATTNMQNYRQSLQDTAKVLNAHTNATATNTEAIKDNAEASQAQASATESNIQSQTKGLTGLSGAIARAVDESTAQLATLTQMGASAKEVSQVFARISKQSMYNVTSISNIQNYFYNLKKFTDEAVSSMVEMDKVVQDATSSLSSQALTMDDITHAQHALSRATAFSVQGIIKLDNAKLNGLKSQIKQAQQQMADMTNTAKNTLQDLESELASLQGREADSQRIKQAQKLADLQAKMAEAMARGNTEEIAHYQKALNLQRQINAEQSRQANQKQTQEQLKNWGEVTGGKTNISAADVANSWNARLEAVREQAKQEAKQEFAKELMDASKRRTY